MDKAFDRQLSRSVALKTLLPELAATPTALTRFKRELLSAQQIVHKNVIRIFDIGEDVKLLTKFITMNFIEGTDLKSMIVRRGKIPPSEAVTIIRQVAQGLEAAHAAGVVHRDLKPQNIMMQHDGIVVVMDFGIAQSSDGRNVTQTGAFLGTPEYMSPEQARTEEVDARSDVFSMGLIFYEMLTGTLAFRGKTMLETMVTAPRNAPFRLRRSTEPFRKTRTILLSNALNCSVRSAIRASRTSCSTSRHSIHRRRSVLRTARKPA